MGYVQSGGGFTINVTGAISGTAGQVAYFDSVNSITSSANFTWNGTTLGVTGVITASTAMRTGDGSVGTPSWSFTAATTMGAYRTGASSWSLSSGNNWVADWGTSGNQIKGSAAAPLKVTSALGNSSFLQLYFDNSGNGVIENTFATGSVYLNSNSITRIAIDSSGNIQLGTGAATPTHSINTAVSATAMAGAGGALPATVTGYWNVNINGNPQRIAFYEP